MYYNLKILMFGLLMLFSFTSMAQPSIGGFNIYYGHLHNHSNVSDGTGTPDEAYSYAKNVGQLDFFSLSDHSGAIDATEWQTIKNAADSYNLDSVFTAFYGFEWTENVLGHVTVINPPDYITTASPNNTFSGFCSWLNANECVAFFNHPRRNNSTGLEFAHFATTPTNKIVGMELWNKTDRFPVYYYTDGYYSNDGGKSWFDEAISRGWMIGAAGAEDNHSGTWGTATTSKLAVLATANTRTEIYNALKARRFFTTYDKNLALSFKIAGSEMGSVVSAATNSYSILVSDAENEIVTKVELLKNGTVVQTWAPNTSLVNISGTLTTQNGEYYYVRIKQADADEAISSPIWCGQVNQLPAVSIISPIQNTSFVVPASIAITVLAGDPDGTIQKVEYYQGSTKIGESVSSPYSFVWANATKGNYTLTAKAFDNSGGTTISQAVNIVVANPGDPITTSSRIASGMDDVEESSTGNILANVNSSDIELVYDASTSAATQVIGLRFLNLNIPKNAVISNAYIKFTCDEISKSACNLVITGEDIDNSSAFTTDLYNVSNRTKTTAKVNWIPARWSTIGEAGVNQQTPNLSAIIQEIIARVGYQQTSALSLIINGTGARIAESFEGSATQAAVLFVTYSVSLENQPLVVSLTSPLENASFTEPASITITADATDADGGVSKVDFLVNDAVIFSDNTLPYSYLWNNVEQGNYSIKAIATDNLGEIATSSEVIVRVNTATGIKSISRLINASSDDAEESSKGAVVTNGDDIELVYDTKTTGSQVVGLRFNTLAIPQGAAITRAYIQFIVDEKTTSGCNLTIKGENSPNSPTFLSFSKNISGRARTSASVNWIPSGWSSVGLAGAAQQTPDLKSIVQEIVNISNWNSDGSMAFIITGTGNGKRTAVSFDTNALKAASLFVEYEDAAAQAQAQASLKSAKIATEKSSLNPSKRELLVYPNPVDDILNIELVSDEKASLTGLEIYNVAGLKVVNQNLNDTKVSVGLGDIPCGIYLVRISTTSEIFLRKVIKN